MRFSNLLRLTRFAATAALCWLSIAPLTAQWKTNPIVQYDGFASTDPDPTCRLELNGCAFVFTPGAGGFYASRLDRKGFEDEHVSFIDPPYAPTSVPWWKQHIASTLAVCKTGPREFMAAYSMRPSGILNATDLVRVTRYWWDPSNDQFVLQPGFPVTVHQSLASAVSIAASSNSGTVDGAIVAWQVTNKTLSQVKLHQQGVSLAGTLFWNSPAFANGVPVDTADLGTAAGGFQPPSVVATDDGMAMVTYHRVVSGVPRHWTAKVARPIAGGVVIYQPSLAPQPVPGQLQAGQPTSSTSRCCVASDGSGGACYGFATDYTNTQLIVSRLSANGTASQYLFWDSSSPIWDPISGTSSTGPGGTQSKLRALSLITLPNQRVLITYRDMTGIRCIACDVATAVSFAWTQFVRGASLQADEADDAAAALYGDTVCILTTSLEGYDSSWNGQPSVLARGIRTNGTLVWTTPDTVINDPDNPKLAIWRGRTRIPYVHAVSGHNRGWLLGWYDGWDNDDGAWLAERLGKTGKPGIGIFGGFGPGSPVFDVNSALAFDLTHIDPLLFSLFEVELGDPNGTQGMVEVYAAIGTSYVGIANNPAAWTLMGSGSVVAAGPGQLSSVALSAPLVLPTGTNALLLRGVGVSLGGSPASGADLILNGIDLTVQCGAQIANWPNGAVSPGRVPQCGIYYENTTLPHSPGAVTTYGAGCYSQSDSVYSYFADAASAAATLSGNALQFLFVGDQYVAHWLPGTFFHPTAGATPLTGFLPNGDDGVAVVPLWTPMPMPGGIATSLTVHSNGNIWSDDNSGALGDGFTPTPATLLAAPFPGFWSWHDFNLDEPGSGQVWVEDTGSTVFITWLNVESFPAGVNNPSTLQYQIDTLSGSVTIVWQTIDTNTSSAFGSSHLVGYSPGGNSIDGGNAALPTLFGVPTGLGRFPLQLSAAVAPLGGSMLTLTTDNVPEFLPGSGIYLAVQILSTTAMPAPGLDLSMLGAPNCLLHVGNLDVMLTMIGFSPTLTATFPIPTGVPTGTTIYAQTAALVEAGTVNAGGLLTSNGLQLRIGN